MGQYPMLAVDTIIQTPAGVVLIRRKNEPYKGKWALPGGFVQYGEKVEEAAVREAEEETGLKVKLRKLVGVYSDLKRDPRGHVVGVCFLASKIGGRLRAASDAGEVKIFKRIPWRELAFDHARILRDAGLKGASQLPRFSVSEYRGEKSSPNCDGLAEKTKETEANAVNREEV